MQREVVDMCIRWNRRTCEPFVLTFNTDRGLRSIPAFPVDRRLYQQYDLTFTAAKVYRRELRRLLASLKPATPYTQDELEKERALWEKKLREDWQRKEDRRLRAAEEGEPEGEIAIAAEGEGEGGIAEAPAEAPPMAEQALAMAQKALLVKHAKDAMIYAEYPTSLDVLLPGPELEAPRIGQIWLAQVNYWITRDIIEAIRKTNEASARFLRKGQKLNLLNAAVKELVNIDINERYLRSEPETTARRRGRRTSRHKKKQEEVPDVLTQRGPCAQYDVVHYSFTVVMPMRFINLLERNLMRRNYHTILAVHAEQAPRLTAQRYYGTDPVMTVKLQGELLLLTAWTRGTQCDWRLTERDVLDWRAFTGKLARQARWAEPSPGKHIWSLLSTKLAQRVTGGTPSKTTRRRIIEEINDLLASEEFYDKASWRQVQLGHWEKALLAKLMNGRIEKAELPHLNRSLLDAAFAGEIAPCRYLPATMPPEAVKEARKSLRR